MASQHGHADVAHNSFAEKELILTRSLTTVQHLCLWHLSTDTQMSHNSFAKRELILTRNLTMVQHLYLWHLSQTKPNSEHPVRYPLNATQEASSSSIHYRCNSLPVASQHGHADVAKLLCEARLILTRSLTMVQHLCLWHLSTDMQMSHTSLRSKS